MLVPKKGGASIRGMFEESIGYESLRMVGQIWLPTLNLIKLESGFGFGHPQASANERDSPWHGRLTTYNPHYPVICCLHSLPHQDYSPVSLSSPWGPGPLDTA